MALALEVCAEAMLTMPSIKAVKIHFEVFMI
jgi:hypothetical protein